MGGAERPGAGPPPLARPCEPHAAPPHHPRTEGSLAAVACALHALEGPVPRLLSKEDILMGCFLRWADTGADPKRGLSALQRVPQGRAVSGPALHEALGWRYGLAATLSRSPASIGGRARSSPRSPPVGAPLGPGSPPRPPRQCRYPAGLDQHFPAPGAPGRGVGRRGRKIRGPLGGHHRRRHHYMPPPGRHRDLLAAAGAVLASVPRVFAMWYRVLHGHGAQQMCFCVRGPCCTA